VADTLSSIFGSPCREISPQELESIEALYE
jgi:hypothetical protein